MKVNAADHPIRYYWPEEHCLKHHSLKIEADVWGLIAGSPEIYSLVLLNPERVPIEVSGERLLAMCCP